MKLYFSVYYSAMESWSLSTAARFSASQQSYSDTPELSHDLPVFFDILIRSQQHRQLLR